MKVKVQKILRLDSTKNGNRRYRVLASFGNDEDVFTVIVRSDDEAKLIREGREIDIIPVREVPYILNGSVEGDGALAKFVGDLKSS